MMHKILLTTLALAIASPAGAMMDAPKLCGKQQSAGEWAMPTNNDITLVERFRANDLERVRELIRHGANQEKPIRNRNKKTCCENRAGSLLVIAILEKNEEMARALIEEGANCNARCYQGDPFNIAFEQDESALILAAERNLTAICKMLLERGADANAQSQNGETPLEWAVKNNNQKLAGLLFSKYKAQMLSSFGKEKLREKKSCCSNQCSIL